MTDTGYIKDRNASTVRLFVTWCAVVYVAFQFGGWLTWTSEGLSLAFQGLKQGLFGVLTPILVFVLVSVISSDMKARLVFWRWRHALPGHRAFSVLLKRDARIDRDKLKSTLGEFPRGPRDQNALWYSIYKRHTASPVVAESHRQFLLARDLTVVACLFALGGTVGLILGGCGVLPTLSYGILMLVQYAVLAVVAQNLGNRFVCNVLAEHSVH